MKTSPILSKITVILLFIISGCVKDDDFSIPDLSCSDPSLVATESIRDIFNTSTDIATQYIEDDIIEGYVVSSDQGGNFFRTLSVQSIDKSAAYSVAIEATDLYTQYEVGRKVWLRLQNLYTVIDFDALTIGELPTGNRIEGIPETTYRDLLVRSCDFVSEENLISSISIQEVGDQYLNQLVQFDRVQFTADALESTYYDQNNDLGGATNHLLTDELGFRLIFRTSSFADFAATPVSAGFGSVKGILTKFRDDYQLLPRTINDVQLDNQRQLFNRISIGALRNFTQDQSIDDSRFVQGVVILSGNNQENIVPRNAVIQDETGGIVFRFDNDAHQLIEGDFVRLNINGLEVDSFGGLIQLETIDFDNVEIVSTQNQLPTPIQVSIPEVLGGDYQSQLVQLNDVQFIEEDVNANADLRGTQTITDCNASIALFTRSAAIFESNPITRGNGSIVAVATSSRNLPQLSLRNLDGISDMTGERCQEPPQAFFTEDFNAGIPQDWNTIGATGNRLWEGDDFGGVFYASISAFDNGNIQDIVSWLITPNINMDTLENETMQIFMADAFQNGNPISLLYSSDYDGIGDPDNFNWTQIGDAEIAGLINNSGFFDNVYEASQPIDLNNITGSVHFAFVYDSQNGSISTSIQLDRVDITGN